MIKTFNCTQYVSNEFPTQAILELHTFNEQTERFIQLKGKTTYFSQVWNIKNGDFMRLPGGSNHHV